MIAKGAALKCFLIVLVCAAGSYAVDCNGFQHRPSDQQVPEGAINATFYCLFDGFFVAWFIDGTGINEIFESPTPPMAISSGTTMIGNAAVNTLTIGALPEYSGIVVTCQAYFLTPNLEVCNATGVLLIRAPPGPVDNLKLHPTPTELQLTWERSLVNTDCTVLYCIDVFKVVGGKEIPVHARCIVDQTNYVFNTSESQPDPNDLFKFTITPRYNVDGARNGTSTNVTGYFTAEPLTLSQESVSVDIVISRDLLVTLTITFRNVESWITGGRKINEFLVEVVLNSGQSYVCLSDWPVVITSSTLSLDANCSGLPVQRRGSVAVTAINHVGNSSLRVPLSTYLLQDIRAQPCHSNRCQVEVIYDVVGDSEVVVGSLIMLYSGEDEIHYFVGRHLDNTTRGGVPVKGLTKDHYNLLVFPLNKSGLPFRFHANPQMEVSNVSAMASDTSEDVDERPVHLSHNGGGCFHCQFSTPSASHCAVIVHTFDKVINISLFERSGDRAEGCVVVNSPGWYYVVAFVYANKTIHGHPYIAGRISLLNMQGGSSIPIEVLLATIVILVPVAVVAVVAVIAVVAWKHHQRKIYKYGKVKHDPTVTFNNLMELFGDSQIMSRWRDLGKELQFPSRKLQAMSSMEDVLNYYTTDHHCNPDWSNIQDVLERMGENQLASVVYTQYILRKAIQTQEQSDSGRYTLTTSVEDNGEDNRILPESEERDVFKSAQPVHKGDCPSSLATPIEGADAAEASERQVHRQATSGVDGAYDEIIRNTLSSQPEGSIHIPIENDDDDAITVIGEGSAVYTFFNYSGTNN